MKTKRLKSFREQMVKLMKQKGVSFRMLDYRTGKSAQYLNSIATGRKPAPPKKTMELIAHGLDVDPEHFDEYRITKAQEKVEEYPELADDILQINKSEAPYVITEKEIDQKLAKILPRYPLSPKAIEEIKKDIRRWLEEKKKDD